MNKVHALQERLVAQLGDQLAPAWRPAFMNAPRHLFAPDQAVWTDDTGIEVPIDRDSDPGTWFEHVYRDGIILIKRDGEVVSSLSMPYMVAGMLDQLALTPGGRVLDIGTGAGWNAGLLASYTGDANTYSIEVDPHVAARGNANLAEAGYRPHLRVGDGALGWPEAAPFDGIIATCAVARVPYPWIQQTPGGIIVSPWGHGLHNGALLRLDVGDGTASGRFVDWAAFMWMGGHKPRFPDEPDEFPEVASRSTAAHDPAAVCADEPMFAAGMLVREVAIGFDRDPEGRTVTVWFLSADSWASVEPATGVVHQMGPRTLWTEIEAAYRWWIEHDQPGPTRFGLTITRNGRHPTLDDQPLSSTAAG